MKNIIWRDDDISHLTKTDEFKQVHESFQKYGVTHTIALIVKDIQRNPELISFIKENDIDVQIHCWEHFDMTKTVDILEEHLINCIGTIKSVFGITPTTVYPPWNSSNNEVEAIVTKLGLIVRPDKISLNQYIRAGGDVAEDVVNFHYWAYEEKMLIEPALRIYTS